MQTISTNVHTFTNLVAGRVYLTEDDEGYTLIDCGLPLAPARIEKQLISAGRDIKAINRIIITHAHPDHVGGLPELKKMTKAVIYAHQLEVPTIQGEQPIPRPDSGPLSKNEVTLEAVKVNKVLADRDLIPDVLGGLRVIHTPGHAPGHVALWAERDRILFAGDVMFHIFGLTLPPRMLTIDMDVNRASIQKLCDLDPRVICCGHGPAITRSAAEKLLRLADKVNPEQVEDDDQPDEDQSESDKD